MTTSTKWEGFLSKQRLRPSSVEGRGDEGNQFLSDHYRVVFSSAFRRLQDKTQVSPLADTDFVRRRLTHSVEVSVVGERMGRVMGHRLADRMGGNRRDDTGKIVATACLLHDLGNPPFGHEGELAIREWADSVAPLVIDARCFDGNAQGFRTAVRLQHHGQAYGLNLTAATLASMVKYPDCPSFDEEDLMEVALSKRGSWGALSSERHHLERVWTLVGLQERQRHPLSYLVEAADDIVNRLVDLEDAIKLHLVSYHDVVSLLDSLGHPVATELLEDMEGRRREIDHGTCSEREQWAYQHFRVQAAAKLAGACEETFETNIDDIEAGTFEENLISRCALEPVYGALKELEYTRIFGDPSIVRVEEGGKTAIRGLLHILLPHVRGSSKLGKTIPDFPRLDHEDVEESDDIRRVVDYVAGMTDGYTIDLYQELSGMSL